MREPLVFNVTSNCKEVQAVFIRVAHRMEDLRPVFLDFQGRMQRSISLNFQRGGRPVPWTPSRRAMGSGRGAHKTGQTLRDRGILLNSVTGPGAYTCGSDFMEISTNVPYARTHQKGAKRGSFGTVQARVRQHTVKSHTRAGKPVREHTVKAHTRRQAVPWGNIPARPFLMVQAADVVYLKRSVARYVFEVAGSGSMGQTGDVT